MLWHEDIPLIKEDNATIKVIAGTYKGNKPSDPAPNSWAANEENEVAVWNIHIDEETEFTLPKATNEVSRTLYFYEGDSIEIEGKTIKPNFGIVLDASKETIIKINSKQGHFLVLQGKPIAEPVAKYGPFVMNTDAEIQQAMDEYRTTQFGGWPWPYPDNVHEKEKGRFAKYPDGNLVEKS
jgi:redox-sensitive bicupin YhaK (pirin superfamily)